MDIVINLENLAAVLSLPPEVLVARFFLYVGWIPIAWFLLWISWQLWLGYIGGIYGSRREFIFLAIDIPVGNEQTPRAVEHMFAHLAGAHGTLNLLDRFWEGKDQDWFSFEIVSIEGYTQFVVWGERKYRGLLEEMVYAQYPDAEITEVDDYTANWPDRFPDDNYDMWGSEFVLVKSQYLPIRTYLDFEHQFSGDFKDPFAAMMELFGSLRKGEQCAFQLIVTPIGQDWEKGSEDMISGIIGEKKPSKPHIVDKGVASLMNMLSKLADMFIPGEAGGGEQKKDEGPGLVELMSSLKPGQKKQIEAVQQKVSKIGFEVKMRWVYMAEKEVMDKTRANSFVGVIKQFGVGDLNSIKPDTNYTMTSTAYLRKGPRLNRRKNALMEAFKSRSNYLGRNPQVLNTEELATLWHFPVELSVRAPLLQKVPSRKAVAPSYLPTEGTAVAQAGGDFDWEGEVDVRAPQVRTESVTVVPSEPSGPLPGDDEAAAIFGGQDHAPERAEPEAAGGKQTLAGQRSSHTGSPPANLPIG